MKPISVTELNFAIESLPPANSSSPSIYRVPLLPQIKGTLHTSATPSSAEYTKEAVFIKHNQEWFLSDVE